MADIRRRQEEKLELQKEKEWHRQQELEAKRKEV
jgi:hypothetical protein